MRPAGKARRPRISGIFERGATPPGGMQRRPNAGGLPPRAARGLGTKGLGARGLETAGGEVANSDEHAAAGRQLAPSPQSRVRSPESRVSSPESSVLGPESRVSSPESSVLGPESPVSSPQSLVPVLSAFVAGVLLWLVPLLVVSGGPLAYWRALLNQGAEDLGNIQMLWTAHGARDLADALYFAFVAPWAAWPVASVVLVCAALGAAWSYRHARHA